MLFPQEQNESRDGNIKSKQSFPSPISNTPSIKIENRQLKRKRSQNEATSPSIIPFEKRLRSSISQPHTEDTACENTVFDICEKKIDPLEYWTKELRWPNEYFEPEKNMNHLLAKKKSSSSLRSKQSEAGYTPPTSITNTDQKPREVKSAPYTRPSYTTGLATKGSFMNKSDLSITDASKDLCRILLETEQKIPEDSLFRDEIFEKSCRKIQDRNEARVVQDIARLIVPSAETLATYGATHLESLIESVNEGWNSSIPFYGPRPQPDYSVGFRRSAFTDDQLEKLAPFVGEITDTFASYFIATWQIYLPFLTSEVKCGAAALDTADRQNAHSMTIAVRGTVELFRLVKREKELHREILGFSISHDHRTVRIYGHYPVIDEGKTTFFRHPIHTFDFTALDGKEKWTAYKFTKNIYDIWMPIHLKRICSVIDDIPSDLNFEVSQQSEPGESGLSQGLGSPNSLEQTSYDTMSFKEADDQSSRITSDTLPSLELEEGVPENPKKRGRQ
ncbi:uncharacterized protein EAE97_000326 [Botrytis byssoidea]|uniref:DUF7924 domain-containing protein n=1 Tax=Botrytis byssoidea TaxID=139641 RepID=A0A9P5IV55_9HELO|nr:uncharacterized protein EAE97_000326 [Botrytis byssoidea]KAF7955067.1 hypothetical protein EAE97_000326 [Botrytis byssoidea]